MKSSVAIFVILKEMDGRAKVMNHIDKRKNDTEQIIHERPWMAVFSFFFYFGNKPLMPPTLYNKNYGLWLFLFYILLA